MKILQIIQRPQFRGAEIFACQISEELIKHGHQVDVLFLFGDSNEKLPFNVNFLHLKGKEKNRWWDFSAYKRLAKLIRNNNYDIVQANAADTLKYSVLSKSIFRWKQPVVYRNASMVTLYIKSRQSKILNALLYKKADYIVSVSKTSMDDLVAMFPFTKNKVTHIPIGIQKTALAIKKQNEVFTIAHVGGFTYEKNHKELLRIFKKLSEKLKNQVKLLLVGDGPLKPAIESLAKEWGLKNIEFIGSQPALPIIRQSDVLVLTSVIEGLPAVLLEAMYCETPVIAYNVGAVSEIVNNGTGTLIPLHDVDAFEKAILELHQAGSGINEKIEKGKALVLKNFTNETISNQFLSVYSSLSEI